jgi:hypothetical protein
MTYTPDIPKPTDIPSQSQSIIRTNFNQLSSVFDIDHVAYNDGTVANRGKHDKSTYIEQGSDPTTAVDEIALYSKDVSGSTRLFLRQENNGSVIQLSGPNPYRNVTANQTEISSFLPGAPGSANFILKAGRVNRTAVGGSWLSGTVSFVTPFPSSCIIATITPQRGTNAIHVMYVNNNTISTTGFQIRSDDNSWDFVCYFAIGL